MKKIVALALFLVVAASCLKAQENDIRFGFQLSPTFSWMNTDDNSINRNGTNLGIRLGVLGEFYFREEYAFSTGFGFAFNHGGGLQFEHGGTYWPGSDLGPGLDTLPSDVRLQYKIQYIEIPLLLKMRTREFGYIRYYLEPGLRLGFESQAKGTITGRGIGDEAEKLNIRKEVNTFNISWTIGGGIEYALSSGTSLVGGLALDFGFTDVTKDKGTIFDPDRGDREEDSKGVINSLTLKLGVLF